ncbi:MAG TPA: OsmC family protein [Bacteroidia bacterium]|nr:OsmC family protein [Bacteroidia bacterium]
MAKVTLHRVNDAYHFEARNASNAVMHLDATPDIGGQNKGLRPVEALVASLGGCSSIDVLLILKKQKQHIDSFDVEMEYERAEDQEPKVIKHINLKFIIKGKVDKDKLERAIQLSLDKYCTVAKMIEKTAKITYSYQIN